MTERVRFRCKGKPGHCIFLRPSGSCTHAGYTWTRSVRRIAPAGATRPRVNVRAACLASRSRRRQRRCHHRYPWSACARPAPAAAPRWGPRRDSTDPGSNRHPNLGGPRSFAAPASRRHSEGSRRPRRDVPLRECRDSLRGGPAPGARSCRCEGFSWWAAPACGARAATSRPRRSSECASAPRTPS